ncbi:hypothetical protein N656DRAFT_184462 [Canariomyces notabilis]|uniref:Uncharacterized protein n=1 Tax=Canariomyces notabilis TaxID=2074819 RepID=A0AAN6QIJ3_9PEZI|nr:hypothetical protein N656DRAFT_184462 [Canariomyces arenarius]
MVTHQLLRTVVNAVTLHPSMPLTATPYGQSLAWCGKGGVGILWPKSQHSYIEWPKDCREMLHHPSKPSKGWLSFVKISLYFSPGIGRMKPRNRARLIGVVVPGSGSHYIVWSLNPKSRRISVRTAQRDPNRQMLPMDGLPVHVGWVGTHQIDLQVWDCYPPTQLSFRLVKGKVSEMTLEVTTNINRDLGRRVSALNYNSPTCTTYLGDKCLSLLGEDGEAVTLYDAHGVERRTIPLSYHGPRRRIMSCAVSSLDHRLVATNSYRTEVIIQRPDRTHETLHQDGRWDRRLLAFVSARDDAPLNQSLFVVAGEENVMIFDHMVQRLIGSFSFIAGSLGRAIQVCVINSRSFPGCFLACGYTSGVFILKIVWSSSWSGSELESIELVSPGWTKLEVGMTRHAGVSK